MLYTEIQNSIDKARALLLEARSAFEVSDFSAAEQFTQEALSLVEPYQNREDLGDAKDTESIKYWLTAVFAHAYNRLQTIASKLSDYTLALKYAEIALDYSDQMNNQERRGGLLMNVGNIYSDLGDRENAMKHYLMAEEILTRIDSKEGLANNLVNISNVYREQKQFEMSIECLQKALLIIQQLGNRHDEAVCISNIGLAWQAYGWHSKSLEYSIAALRILDEIGPSSDAALIFDTIGNSYADPDFEGHDLALAEEFYLKAISTAETFGIRYDTIDFYKHISELYKRQNRWEECCHYLEKHHALREELKSAEASKQAWLMEQRQQLREREQARMIEQEHAKATQNVLYRVLPASIAERLVNGEKIADYFDEVSILFADIVGFTPIAAQMSASAVIDFLNHVFREFDRIIEKHGCQKIKTMGDGIMAVCGAPQARIDHAECLARAALDLMKDIVLPESIRRTLPENSVFRMRIGLHTGPAFAGIIGDKGFVYDLYSDAVNLASRMESSGVPGKIHCSEEFVRHVKNRDNGLAFVERGDIEIKGKGMMHTYFLERA